MVEDQNKDSQSRLEINVIRWTVLSPAPFFNRFMTGGSDQRQRKKTAAILGGKSETKKRLDMSRQIGELNVVRAR